MTFYPILDVMVCVECVPCEINCPSEPTMFVEGSEMETVRSAEVIERISSS
jgi:Pyruvate/2-oxoacid:ferredoxin oxidoreductase delta subunit